MAVLIEAKALLLLNTLNFDRFLKCFELFVITLLNRDKKEKRPNLPIEPLLHSMVLETGLEPVRF